MRTTRQQGPETERHADRLAVSLCGAHVAARAHHRVAEATAVHALTIDRMVRPLWNQSITPVTLLEAYEVVWTRWPGEVTAVVEILMNAPDSPGDTYPGLAERCGGQRYPLMPGLRGELPLAGLSDLDRRCSAILARQQIRLMTALSWPQIKARFNQGGPLHGTDAEGVAVTTQDPVG